MKRIRLSADVAIFSAEAYADIFEYPLTEEELRTWLPFVNNFKRPLPAVYPELVEGQGEALKTRVKRAAWSKEKWERAKRVVAFLRFIPTVQLAGVTGGLAMNNAKKEDDIDLFFIASCGTVWITRLLVTCAVECLGIRRKPGEKDVRNKICLNMFVADDALSLPKNERDFFAAHEVLQMVPLWERGAIYKKFLLANRWAKKFLPNAWEEKSQISNPNVQQGKRFSKNPLSMLVIVIWSLRFIEPFFRNVQLWYMRRRRSTETVTDTVIRFHPADARLWIKKAFAKRLAKRNVPLDKIFYGR